MVLTLAQNGDDHRVSWPYFCSACLVANHSDSPGVRRPVPRGTTQIAWESYDEDHYYMQFVFDVSIPSLMVHVRMRRFADDADHSTAPNLS